MKHPLLAILFVVLLMLTTASLWLARGAPQALETTVETEAQASVGGAFSLTDQNGEVKKNSDFHGRLMLVFFGFTHCPDICPATLSTLTTVMNGLGDKAKQVAPILITVDPPRDTSARMKEYLANFHPSITGLTGTSAQIEQALAAYKAYAGAPQQAGGHSEHGGEYVVPHSGLIYLMDRSGNYITHFSQADTAEQLRAALEPYLQ